MEQNNFLHNLLKKQYQREDDIAMVFEKNKEEMNYSWLQVKTNIQALASFFLDSGLETQDRVGIFSNNSPEWHFVDFACLQTRMCVVPIYPTTMEDHLEHIVNDSGLKIIFVEGEEQLNKINSVKDNCPSLEKIILMKDNGVLDICSDYIDNDKVRIEDLNEIENSIQKEDLVTLIYTSGTTGMPKGVMLDNENFSAAIDANKERISVSEKDRSLCFLPLSHIFERAWSYYVMVCGGQNYYIDNPQNVAKLIKKAQPTLMSSVPRFFEKIYTKVQTDLDNASSSKRKIFKWATRVGRKIFARKMNNEMIGPFLYLQFLAAEKLVFSKFKDSFGGKVRFFNCGGAALQNDVNMFFQSLSLPIIYGYGLTETLATVSCYTKIPAIGSIGKPIKGVEVKIDKENNDEILVRGASITKGYYNLPEENSKSFTEDGWFRTGDAGRIDSEGNLYYTERIKELMKTSNGKYVAPQNVEGTIMKDKFVDQIAIVAEGETFVSALIVPDYHLLEEYAKEKAIAFKDKKELLENTDIKKMLEDRLKEVQENLHGFEKVKKFKLLEKPFSVLENEITPTLKLKRKVIMKKYKHLIDEIYNKKKKK
jgi:long-chain acyl-CoA synthetase